MATLILNRFNLARVRYPDWCREGEDLVLITSSDSVSAQESIRSQQLDGYRQVVTVENYADSSVPEFTALDLHETYDFDRILAMSEFDILRAARLREAMGLPGQSYKRALLFRDKLLMKDRLRAAGVPVAEYVAVDNATDLRGAADQLGYPFVLKPRLGAASVGVSMFHDADELRKFVLRNALGPADAPARLLAEAFASNDLFHIDGIVDDGRVRLCWPSEQDSSCLDITKGIVQISTALEPADPRLGEIQNMTRLALEALGVEEVALFHAEIFSTEAGLVFNEVGCRVGGAKIRDQLEHGFGVDPIEWFARAYLDGRKPLTIPSRPLRQTGFALVPTRAGVVQGVRPFERPSSIVVYEPRFTEGDVLTSPASSAATLASFVSAAHTRAQVQADLESAVTALEGAVDIADTDLTATGQA